MSNQSVERTVCCYVLKGTHLLFSDERIKWHLLNRIGLIQKQEGWDIYAFCLTDREAYFIAEAKDPQLVQRRLQTAADQILDQLEVSIFGRTYAGDRFIKWVPEVLNAPDEIADRCRQIHTLPVLKGYVSRPGDYWWSSYNTYIGIFDWTFMNIRMLLQHFSADHEEAVCRFRYFHRCRWHS